MRNRRCAVIALTLCLWAWAGLAGAQDLKIGVVDVPRLIRQSPQADRAKSSMATQFAGRKNRLETKSDALQQDVGRLKRNGSVMSNEEREQLQSSIRDRQRELQMEQSKYNDDVAEAEQKEFNQMRKDIRDVIDAYAEKKGFDLIIGDGALYASDAIDITDEILAQLKQR